MMRDINSEILTLLTRYHGDTKRILKENKKLEYLYALSPLRENVLEWFSFDPSWEVLQLGADFGALTGLLLAKCGQVTVAEKNAGAREVVRTRYESAENLLVVSPEEIPEEKRFDCITMIGTLKTDIPAEGQVREAVLRLRSGGVLLLAVQNRYGMKFLSGTPRTEASMTTEELKKLLPGGRFYYPMPDYKTASVIYSDGYLPQKGDFAGMPALYDAPKYQLTDMGESLEQAVADGKFAEFANSYLVVYTAP